jgi:hypothetical protein
MATLRDRPRGGKSSPCPSIFLTFQLTYSRHLRACLLWRSRGHGLGVPGQARERTSSARCMVRREPSAPPSEVSRGIGSKREQQEGLSGGGAAPKSIGLGSSRLCWRYPVGQTVGEPNLLEVSCQR